MIQAMAGVAFSRGWILVAVAVLVGYDGLFRVMELLSLRVRDISGSVDNVSLVITLHETKTSNRKSVSERAIKKILTLRCCFVLS